MAKFEVKLPDIGEGVNEGELVKWLCKVGDSLKVDQPIAEVMTDKATVEVPTGRAGRVVELKFKEGDVIPIETVMVILEAEGASKSDGASSSTSAASAGTPAAPASVSATPGAVPSPMPASAAAATVSREPAAMSAATLSAPGAGVAAKSGGSLEVFPPVPGANVLATPATRRLARELNVDLNKVTGTGLAGRVTREDVLGVHSGTGAVAAGAPMVGPTALGNTLDQRSEIDSRGRGGVGVGVGAGGFSGGPAGTQTEERVALKGVRKKIAENLQMAKRVVPHFTLMEEADVTELAAVRTKAKAAAERAGVKVTYLPFVMKALVATLREFPMLNASIDDEKGEIVYKKYFHLGFAADTPSGLLVPNIKFVDQKSTLQLSREITELAAKARAGKLSLDEMRGATITITNIGSVGGMYATPIINHPEVAILGMYKIAHKPFWDGQAFVPRMFMNFTITCDHRLVDGAVAARFMKSFVERIENPSQLLLDMM